MQQRMMEGRFDKEKEVFVVIKTTCKWPARPRKSDSLKDKLGLSRAKLSTAGDEFCKVMLH